MDWTVSLGEEPGVMVFNRDGVFIAVMAMLIGTGADPTAAKATAEDVRREAQMYQQDRRRLHSEGPLEYRIELGDERFVLLKSAY